VNEITVTFTREQAHALLAACRRGGSFRITATEYAHKSMALMKIDAALAAAAEEDNDD